MKMLMEDEHRWWRPVMLSLMEHLVFKRRSYNRRHPEVKHAKMEHANM